MPNKTPSERAVSTVLGALFGAGIGFAITWLLTVYSNTLGVGVLEISHKTLVVGSACLFAFLGLISGSHVGTLIGSVIHALFEFERMDTPGTLFWLVGALVCIVLIGTWVWVSRGWGV